MEDEMKPEETTEAPAEPVEEAATEAPAKEEATEEAPAAKVCECSAEETKSAEDLVRDLINLVAVYKEEEKEGVTTRIDPDTAEELSAKLEELSGKIGGICSCA